MGKIKSTLTTVDLERALYEAAAEIASLQKKCVSGKNAFREKLHWAETQT
jgi:hypothetical protein